MINSKHLNKIALALIALSLLVCALIVYLAQTNTNTNTKITAYESKLFGDGILAIDISVDEEDWQGLLNDPTAKEYIPADLTINGETFSSVGLRTKGNSSLTQIAQMADSDRYSIHFKFDQYQKGQTYYGLDTFCINNLVGDNTYMKDYIAYDIMDYIGVPSPLKNYATVTVNGEDFGFYLALERYEKSFLDRVYDTSGGQLYNVKIQMGQREEFMGGIAPGGMSGRRGGAPGGMDGGRGGGDLVYTDDNIDSYSSIFDNAEFKGNSDKDKQRVIDALKNLSDGTDFEKHFDVDEILRYLAAHTVVVNLDSYSSSMAQNYYIYERDGRISILPWDYGLSFGGFQSGDANSVINFPIDTPVSGVSMEDRPLINKLLEVPEYKEKYHEYLRQIVDGYFNSGIFEDRITALDAKINEYVKNDTTSFTTYENYSASLPILIKLGELRAQSIDGQLNGTIPSTTESQNANKDSLISGDGIDLSALGTFMGGGGNRGKNFEGNDWPWVQGQQGQNHPEFQEGQEDQGRPKAQEGRQGQNWPGTPGDQSEFPENIPKGGLENLVGRNNSPGQNIPERQDRPSTSSSVTAANNTNSVNIILTGILLLIMVIATFLLARFKKKV